MATSSPKGQRLLPMHGTTFDSRWFSLMAYLPTRALLHDEEVYPQASKFWPERFLDDDGQINRNVRNPDFAAFGFSRRLVYLDMCLK